MKVGSDHRTPFFRGVLRIYKQAIAACRAVEVDPMAEPPQHGVALPGFTRFIKTGTLFTSTEQH
jgi:hypothetical protein